MGDFTHIAMARQSPTGVGSHNKTNRPQGWAPTTKPIAHRGGLPQQNHRPQGWAPTKANTKTTRQSPTGWAPTKTQNIAKRLTKKGPLVAALFGLAGLVRLQHVLVDQQLG